MQKPKNDKLRVGVIGVGRFAQGALIPQLLETGQAELVSLSRRNRRRLDEAGNTLRVDQVFTDWRELLKHTHPDAVIVATSHDSHAEITIAALDAGVNVFVEKPMALTAESAWAMVAAADKAERVLMVGYNSRLHPVWQAAKRALESGAIGKVRQLSTAWSISGRWLWETKDAPEAFRVAQARGELGGDWIKDGTWLADPKQAGGGLFVSDATHVVDLTLWLGGARVEKLMGFQENAGLPTDCFMSTHAVLANGAQVSVVFGAGVGGVDEESPGFFGDGSMTVHGDEGVLKADWRGWNPSRNVTIRILTHGEMPLEAEEPALSPIASFVDTVVSGGPNRCSGREGAYAVEFVESAYRSAAEDRLITVESRE